MNRFHLITGVLTIAVFLVSGVYMLLELNLPEQDMDAQRMMYRASHIYLLFVGCLNVMVGAFMASDNSLKVTRIQFLASVSVILSQPILVAAFIVEPRAIDSDRLLTLLGCVLVLVGSLAVFSQKIWQSMVRKTS